MYLRMSETASGFEIFLRIEEAPPLIEQMRTWYKERADLQEQATGPVRLKKCILEMQKKC